MRYRAFRRKKDNLFYFQFLSENNESLLSSQSYAEKNTCFEGIRSVMQNAASPERYEKSIDGEGKHFFILKATNGQEIGRSIKYDSEGALDTAITQFSTEAPTATSKTSEKTEEQSAAAPLAVSDNSGGEDGHELDDYNLSRASTSGQAGFETFRDEDSGKYYFHYNDGNGVALLFSQAYTAASGRDNGVESVKKNAEIEGRYEVHQDDKGYYYILKAGNNQEIARSRYFASAEAMADVIDWFANQASGRAEVKSMLAEMVPTPTPASAPANDGDNDGKIYKDYRPLEFYQEHIEGEAFGYDAFANDDKFYFTVNHEGKPVLISEDYTSASGRDNGIDSVKKNVKKEERYEAKIHPNGKHYFNLLAGNKQEIATSRWFDNKKEMNKAMRWLQSTGGTRRRKKAQRTKVETERIYISQNQSYPCNEITYDTFQSGGNQKYYFVFKNKEGKAVLINGDVRGYNTQEDLENGIKEVLKFAPSTDKIDRRTTKNGKHYFYIQNDDGKNIARGSLFYELEEDMNKAIGILKCAAVAAVPAAAPVADKVIDDYLPCDDYAGTEGFYSFFREDKKEYYFSYNRGGTGKVVLRSEGYTTAAARDNGIQSVIKNAPIEKRWGTDVALNGKYHYYYLRAGNHQEIARSCYYDSEAAMMDDYNWLLGEDSPIGAGSAMVGGALMSASMIRGQEAEKARLAAEAEAKRKAEEAEKARLAAEAEAKRKAEEAEKARLAAEAEAKRKAEEAEKVRLAAAAAAAAAANQKVVDDYMPCEAYNGAEGFHSFYDDDRKEYFFAYNKEDGNTLLRSEGYTTAAARDNGIQSVIKNAPIEKRWGKDTALNGKYHYYYLRAGNNQEIARSCYYEDEAAMLAAFGWLQGADSPIGAGSALVGGALMSAAMIRKGEEETAAAEAEKTRLAAVAAAEVEAKRKAEEAEKARLAALAAAAAKKKEEEEAAAAAALAAANLRAEEDRKKKAAAAAAAAATAAAAVTRKKEAAAAAAYTEADTGGGGGWLRWLIPLLIGLALIAALLYFMKGCEGCKTTPPPVIDNPVSDTITTDVKPTIPEPYGKGGAELGFVDGSMEYLMADHLRGPETSFPRSFQADKITFPRNSARLNTAAKRQLDNIAVLLKEYPNARININGYLTDNENSAYRGSKEVSLDDVRAREVYNYLKSLGIDESRMNFQGNGTNDRRSVDIELISRD